MIESKEKYLKLLEFQTDYIKEGLRFYLFENVKKSDSKYREFTLDNFIKAFLSNDPTKNDSNNLFLLNKLEGGKQQVNFKNSNVVFIDIDFHSKDDVSKQSLIDDFLSDTESKSFEDFIKKSNNDRYCLLSSLSKSKTGIRMIYLVESYYSLYNEIEDHEFDTETIVKLHKSNFEYVKNYVINFYKLNADAKYISVDNSASGIQQGTFFTWKENSYVNKDCEIMFNDIVFKSEDEKSISNIKCNIIYKDYSSKELEELYLNDNKPFIEMLNSWEPNMKLLTYVLPKQSDEVLNFFYVITNKHYAGTTFKYSKNRDKFISYWRSKIPKKDLPLEAFLRLIGYKIKYTLIDEDIFYDNRKILSSTPFFPEKVYDNLPTILRNMTSLIDDARERDAFLTSQITAFSSLFTNMSTIYYKKKILPNLYCYIAAPSGGGKSIVDKTIASLENIENCFNKDILNEDGKTIGSKRYIIGADSSLAAMISLLKNNNGVGIIYSPEADIMVKSFEQKWGNYSTLLRVGYDNVKYDASRVGITTIIEKLKNSCILTGTPSSILKLINDENGTMSRFLYYIFSKEPIFLDPDEDADDYYEFEKYNNEIKKIYDFYENYDIRFNNLNKEQRIINVQYFRDKIKKYNLINDGSNIDGAIKRYGATSRKLMMTLSAIEHYENRFEIFNITEESGGLYVDEIELEITQNSINLTYMLMNVYFKHMDLILNNVSDSNNIKLKGNNRENFIDKFLSFDEISRKNLLKIAEEYKIAERTLTRIIDELTKDGKIIKKGRFIYEIIKK